MRARARVCVYRPPLSEIRHSARTKGSVYCPPCRPPSPCSEPGQTRVVKSEWSNAPPWREPQVKRLTDEQRLTLARMIVRAPRHLPPLAGARVPPHAGFAFDHFGLTAPGLTAAPRRHLQVALGDDNEAEVRRFPPRPPPSY